MDDVSILRDSRDPCGISILSLCLKCQRFPSLITAVTQGASKGPVNRESN